MPLGRDRKKTWGQQFYSNTKLLLLLSFLGSSIIQLHIVKEREFKKQFHTLSSIITLSEMIEIRQLTTQSETYLV